MKDGYFGTLRVCISISLVLLAMTTAFSEELVRGLEFLTKEHAAKAAAFMSLFVGAIPLVYYHFGYLRPRALKGLSQAAIDSVYYYGFLVTVAALGISAIAIARSGAAVNIDTVVFQFGVGLFATGYAVFARMHLSSIATLDVTSPEAVLDRYLKRSLEMVDNVEIAVQRTADFSRIVSSKTEEIVDTARTSAEKSMLQLARAFEHEIKTTMAMAREGLTEIRGLVSDTSFAAEREELARSLKTSIEAISQLNTVVGEFKSASGVGARVMHELTSTSSRLEESLRQMHVNIGELISEEGTLVKSAESIKSAVGHIASGTADVATAVKGLKDLAKDVAETGPTFKNLRTANSKVFEQVEAISKVAERLDVALRSVSGSVQPFENLVAEMSKVTEAFPQLTSRVEGLRDKLDGAAIASGRMEDELNKLPADLATFGKFSVEMEGTLRGMAQALERLSSQSNSWDVGAERAAKIIEGAQLLISGAADLRETIELLRTLAGDLTKGVRTAQGAVVETTNELKASFRSTAIRLDEDVAHSSKAASEMINTLVLLAETIIDRTRAHQRPVA